MTSQIGGTIETPDVQLFVTDKDNKPSFEVLTNGTERKLGIPPIAGCSVCVICKSGKPPVVGHILGGDSPTIFDALEILKYLVKIDSEVK